MWLDVGDGNIYAGQPKSFDLQAKVKLRGEGGMAGPVWFESKFYLSRDETLDDNDTEVRIWKYL